MSIRNKKGWNKRVYFTVEPLTAKIFSEVAKECGVSRNSIFQDALKFVFDNYGRK